MGSFRYKKLMVILLGIAIMIAAAGCSGNAAANGHTTGNQNGVADILQAGMTNADATADAETESDTADVSAPQETSRQSGLNDNAPQPVTEAQKDTVLSSTEGIDIDLTSLSGTMVYSEVYNMMYMPEQYIGKTIKMHGVYTAYHEESTGNDYFACIIQDATACCSQGIEFILTDDYSYPEDYPTEGDLITVAGVFDTYTEGNSRYCTLRNAILDPIH